MRLGQLSLMGLLAVGSLVSTGSAFADPVSGMANITGSVDVSKSDIAFNSVVSTPVGANNTGSFAGLTGGTVNHVLTGGPTYGPVDPALGKDFITFNVGSSNIDFDLQYIEQGEYGTPFTFSQTSGGGLIIGLKLDGVSYYAGMPDTGSSTTSGVYSTQINVGNETAADFVASVENGMTITGQSYSATFTASPTPEPASWLLMSAGLLGAGFIARRKAQAAKSNA